MSEVDHEIVMILKTNVFGSRTRDVKSAAEIKRVIEVALHRDIEMVLLKESEMISNSEDDFMSIYGKKIRVERHDRNARQDRGEL